MALLKVAVIGWLMAALGAAPLGTVAVTAGTGSAAGSEHPMKETTPAMPTRNRNNLKFFMEISPSFLGSQSNFLIERDEPESLSGR
jgi:hypothetical protein